MKKETREGYKFTELGEMPIEWTIKSIDELIEENIILEVMDGNHGAIHPKSSDYTKRGIPFIMANNFSKGRIDVKNCKYISRDLANTLRKGFAIEGDVLLTHKGTLGETAIVPSLENGFIVLTPQVTYYRVSKNNKLLNKYLKIYFDSKYFQDSLKSLGSQSTRDYVGITEQKKMKIVLPQIKEQEKIAEILSVVDEQIENTERLIQKNQKLKKGLMQQLLTKGIGHTEFKKTELGEIPDEWEIKNMKSIVKSTQLGTNTLGKNELGIPMLKMGNLEIGGFNFDKLEYITKDELNENLEFILKTGDFLFNTRNTLELVGKSAVWNNKLDLAIFNSNIMRIKYCNEINSFYMGYYFASSIGWKELKAISTGTTSVAAIYTKDLMNTKVIVPPLKEQEKIVEILSTVDEQIENTKKLIQKNQELKKGLMQQLLTGYIRII